jgi:hypothetical protein
MRIHAVYDGQGHILAAARVPEVGGQSYLKPVAKDGQHSAILEVPAEHSRLSFEEVCRRLVVETAPGNKTTLRLAAGK